jgi:hypothetical protein
MRCSGFWERWRNMLEMAQTVPPLNLQDWGLAGLILALTVPVIVVLWKTLQASQGSKELLLEKNIDTINKLADALTASAESSNARDDAILEALAGLACTINQIDRRCQRREWMEKITGGMGEGTESRGT